MNQDLLSYLRCPVCGQPLAHAVAGTARALRCPRGHSFDIARQGYVNLSVGRASHAGDTAEMVVARETFLAAGHYDFISATLRSAALAETARMAAARTGALGPGREPDRALVVDAGAGTGRHLGAVLDALPDAVGIGLDVSKPALRRAARAHPRAAAALCDTWHRLPVADASAALVLNVFAPRNGTEFRRILRPDGALLVVIPAADHLHELVGLLDLLRVDPAKSERVAGHLAGRFDQVAQRSHRVRLELGRQEVHTLVGMGPSAWHTDPDRIAERVGSLAEPVTVTASVRVAVYHPAARR